jgi:uncharacterized YigZ family protein
VTDLQKEYKTIFEFATTQIEEKKSRFISSVMPVKTEEEAVSFINSLKSKYWDASHNVYSYFTYGDSIIQRYSDDGEPSGTAGLPVLEVIKRTGVQDLVVVVTRYFGGTLLGAAGLIRAYSKSAALGIEAAGIIKKQLCFTVSLTVEYTLLGKVQSLLASNQYTVKNVKYQQDAEIELFIPVDEVEIFNNLIIEATNARVLIEIGEKIYITLGEDGKLIL